jgi:hypothetical protein
MGCLDGLGSEVPGSGFRVQGSKVQRLRFDKQSLSFNP